MKVVLCGTKFGFLYLRALARADSELQVVGILSKGGARSRAYATELGISHYTSVDELPADVDVACVAVRGSFLGGDGTKLARSLLERKIHVLQEHPLHSSEIRQCKEIAHRRGVAYHVNTHFPNVAPVRRFIDFCRETVQQQRPTFISVETGLSYSAIDIVGRCLGGLTPFATGPATQWSAELLRLSGTTMPPFVHTLCVLGGVPASVSAQSYHVPQDPDNNFALLHRVSIVFPSGTVTLANTHGPVLWHRPFAVPEYEKSSEQGDLSMRADALSHHRNPTSVTLCEAYSDGWYDIVAQRWPRAVSHALSELQSVIEGKPEPPHQTVEHLSAVSHAWFELMRTAGWPEAVDHVAAPDPIVDPVRFARASRFVLGE